VQLPTGTGDQPLRLDIAGKPAVIDFATLALRKEDGHTLWNWNPKGSTDQLRVEGTASRLPEPEFFRVLALNSSARVFLPELSGAEFQQPLELEIRFRIDLELKALKELSYEKSTEAPSASLAAMDAAVAKAKADSARYLAQSRIEYDAKVRQIAADADARMEAMRTELDTLRSEMEVLKVRHQQDFEGQNTLLEEERAHHQVTRLEKETLVAQHPLMLQELSIAQRNVEELKAEVERISAELATAEFDLSELRKLNTRMAAALEEERSMRIQMEESGSWQLTKPIRAVGDLFGPRRKY
jgi:chromosome segregation ATPase